MCLFILLIVLAYMLVVVFFETARILLPWTVSATILAGLAGLGVRALVPPSSRFRTAAGFITTIILTIALGYLEFFLFPAKPPPQTPPKQNLEGLIEAMTELPKPDISVEHLRTMLPIHLAIAGLIGAFFVLVVSRRLPNRNEVSPFAAADKEVSEPPRDY